MGTQVFSTAVQALGRESVVFLPTVAAPAAVTVAEANATGSVHLTCNIRGFVANGAQTKTKKYRLCSIQGFDQLGRVDWTIDRPIFIDDPQAADSSTAYPHKSLVSGMSGWILRRRGLASDPGNFTAFAAGQRYDLFQVTFGVRQPVPVQPDQDGQEFEYEQEIAVIGSRYEGVIAA